MNQLFEKYVSGLEERYQLLCSMEPVLASDMPMDCPRGGVYLFYDSETPLYVGRTKRLIRDRVPEHYRSGDDSPFAWLIAREKTGREATYGKKGSRRDLLDNDTEFLRAYNEAKTRIRNFTVRYVGESDSTTQAILEIYVAVVTGAKYNNFDTH